MKPILFNTEMVRAILDGRKTVTRRVIKYPHCGYFENEPPRVVPPYQPGQILYVRETWQESTGDGYFYRADFLPDRDKGFIRTWRPSIHMPKDAARIFLRVTNVRVELLQDITDEQAICEGCNGVFVGTGEALGSGWDTTPCEEFSALWDSTIKKADLDKYGWEANPFVWVIEFERGNK